MTVEAHNHVVPGLHTVQSAILHRRTLLSAMFLVNHIPRDLCPNHQLIFRPYYWCTMFFASIPTYVDYYTQHPAYYLALYILGYVYLVQRMEPYWYEEHNLAHLAVHL